MSDLLPCPFCGKNAKSIHKKLVGYKIMCMWCHTSTPNYRLEAKMAKADWNRRADHVNELVAAAYEDAAVECRPMNGSNELDEWAARIINLTPTDASAALAARDARVREAALKEAAEICTGDGERPEPLSGSKLRRMTVQEQFAYEQRRLSWLDAGAILALIAKDTTNG